MKHANKAITRYIFRLLLLIATAGPLAFYCANQCHNQVKKLQETHTSNQSS